MSYGVGCRRGSDPELLWLWHRPAATALMRPLAWDPPYATGVALEKTKKGQKKKILQITNPGEDVEKKEPLYELLGRTETDSQTLKNLWLPKETSHGGVCLEGKYCQIGL